MIETPQTRYNKANIKNLNVPLNIKTEQDIIQKLSSVENKSGYIKSLIRADIVKTEKQG